MHRSVATAACAMLLMANAEAAAAVGTPRNSAPEAARPGASATAELLGVRLNDVEQPDAVLVYREPTGSLAVPVAALAQWRVRRPDAPVLRLDGHDCVALDAIPGARWRVDAARQLLVLDLPPAAFERHQFEMSGPAQPAQTGASLGGFV
ncbi:MAG TPA: hypothetical protein VFA35_11820, partial [Burkholderiaceae bacterium]|nr:hypothetical protein [Burkholderiaceae bacterium]